MSRKTVNSPRARPKIFNSKERNSRFTYTNNDKEEEDDLVVVKHSKPNEVNRHTISDTRGQINLENQWSPKSDKRYFLSP